MSDFNYQAYLKNNPLLKEKVKDQLITESQEVEEVEIPTASLTKINAEVKNVQTMAQAILDFIEQVKEKEAVDFGANATMKIVLDKLNTLAKTEEKAVAESQEIEEKDINITQDEMDKLHSDGEVEKGEDKISYKMKVSELKAKIKEDIISLLQEEEEEEENVEAEIEDEVDVEVDTEEPALDASDAQEGLTADEKEIQDSLKIAYDNAVAIGDKKLADQIGNSITFFTRSHVVER